MAGEVTIPLIGVSTYVADARWGGWERRAAVLPESYFELVAAAGGRPCSCRPRARPRAARGRARTKSWMCSTASSSPEAATSTR